jgi:protein-disulfide isomerase
MDRKMVWGAGLGGLAIGAGAVALAGQGPGSGASSERAAVERIVREYILANPEILPEAMKLLQDRELGKAVDANRAAYETPYGSAWAGSEKADVVLVEFFDYACGYCRRSNPDVERLLEEDDELKVVWRELPVLGPDSLAATEVSLAAAGEGKFRKFHDTLFALGRPTPENVAEARRAAGIGTATAPATARAEVQKNYELARAIGASGTPTFVIGDQVLQGAVGYETLKKAVETARKAG